MVEAIVKKIMTTGINKYAKLYNVPAEQVQIRVTNDPNGTVFYTMYKNFKEVERITFLQIMDKKMDILQYEALGLYANDTNDDVLNVSSFIMRRNNDIELAFYNGYKNGKYISLGKHLGELGL